jgi:hypothetical protein
MSGKERFTRRPSSTTVPQPGATELLSAPTNGGQVAVLVFGYSNGLFNALVDELYSGMEGTWYDTTRTQLPVTRDEFRTYCVMAARTRISRVNNERRHVWPLRTNDQWSLPTQIANMVNSVGRVFMDETASLIVPIWPEFDASADPVEAALDTTFLRGLVDTDDFFVRTTMKMRRIEAHFKALPGVPVVFVDHIASEIEGDPDVMCLVPVYSSPTASTAGEEPVRLHARTSSDRMVNGTVAFNYLAWALLPSVYQQNHVLMHPLEIPGGRFIDSQAVHSTWMRLLAKAVS